MVFTKTDKIIAWIIGIICLYNLIENIKYGDSTGYIIGSVLYFVILFWIIKGLKCLIVKMFNKFKKWK